jgi:very-short-patch-repair endonuclease
MVSATTKLERAKSMRREPTAAEARLWSMLRNRGLGGAKFRRQVPIGPFIVDFVCHDAMLIVEADGGQHAGSASDARRDAYLKAQGYRLLRLWNNDVIENREGVASTIFAALSSTPHPPTATRRAPPSPRTGRGVDGASHV